MMEEEGEGDALGNDARRRREDDDPQLQPLPPPSPANIPPPSRSPPPVLAAEANRERAMVEGDSWKDYLFGSPDAVPRPPPTLDPSASGAAKSSWLAERRMPVPPPPPSDSDQQPTKQLQPVPSAEKIAEGKKPTAQLVTRRSAMQKPARKPAGGQDGQGHHGDAARPGDVLHRLDDHFPKASQRAHEVSKLLKAARMHYHSNFTEKRE